MSRIVFGTSRRVICAHNIIRNLLLTDNVLLISLRRYVSHKSTLRCACELKYEGRDMKWTAKVLIEISRVQSGHLNFKVTQITLNRLLALVDEVLL